MKPHHEDRIVGVLELVTAGGILLFWIGFFFFGLVPKNPPEGYFIYEHAFVVPDVILAGVLILSGAWLCMGHPLGRTWSLGCAGALMFLGVVDASFNVQNGLYTGPWIEAAANGFINLWCVVVGVIIAVRYGPTTAKPF